MNTAVAKPAIAAIKPPVTLNPGEIYVGLATDPLGQRVHHVILLPGDGFKNWAAAKEWAANIGGELPTRTEALLLLHALRDEFKREWYWTSEQHADDPSCAWVQGFGWGDQDYDLVDSGFRCRAVRRVAI